MEHVKHGFKRVGEIMADALERSTSLHDEEFLDVPSVDDSDRFEAVRERQRQFIENADRAAIEQLRHGSGPLRRSGRVSRSVSADKPLDVIVGIDTPEGDLTFDNGLPPRGCANVRKSNEGSVRASSSNASERRNTFGPMSSERGQALSPFANAKGSLDSSQRGPSVELGYAGFRGSRSAAIQLGPRVETSSTTPGVLDDVTAMPNGRVIRRRVVLPYQVTLLFGAASIVGVGIGCGILAISIRNATYLQGPHAGPQLPEIRDLLYQVLNVTAAINERL